PRRVAAILPDRDRPPDRAGRPGIRQRPARPLGPPSRLDPSLWDWCKPSHNVGRQFRSLVRHMIARYDVPAFLDAAWLAGLTVDAVQHQGWYKHIASGRNIRTAPDLPIPLTKKQAHHFLRAPDDFDIPSAFRWAVIVDLGGDERMVRSILGTWIG